MGIDRRTDNRRWKAIDDLWKEAFDDHVPALTVTGAVRDRDAFGRQRTSEPANRLDVEFLYNKQVDYFDETTNNGTVTHNTGGRDLTLSLGDANNGSFAKMASYPVPYTPGNSQLVEMTGVLDLADLGTGTAEVFIRSNVTGSPVETTLEQSSWATLQDGMDWSTAHIFVIDFQSLKVGTVRFGFFQDGVLRPVAQIDNDNVRNVGYWQIPNGSVYYHLYTTGGTTYMELGYGNANNAMGFRYKVAANASATMKAICCTVKSEGGTRLQDQAGLPRTASTGVTEVTASTTLVPIISIRSKDTFNSLENLILTRIESVQCTATQPTRIVVVADGALTGASWSDVNTNHSCMEVDTSASVLTGGTELLSYYIASGAGAAAGGAGATLGKAYTWNRLGAQSGIITVAAIKTGAQDSSVLASINWEEIR